MKRKLLFIYAAILMLGANLLAQDLIVGGNMEDQSKWTEVVISTGTQTKTFNYTTTKPTGATGGCLRITGTGGNTAICQQVTLKKMVEYKADMLFKDQSANLDQLWFQLYLTSSQPLPNVDITNGMLKEFNTWAGCAKGVDGLMSAKGCNGSGLNFTLGKTAGDTTIWFVIKWGSLSSNPYDLLVDSVSLVPSKVSGLSLTSATSKVGVGQSLSIAPNFIPVNVLNKSLTWSVINTTGTATIDANGVITGVSLGTVTVKAVSDDVNSIIAQLDIEVVDPIVFVTSVNVTGDGDASVIDTDKGTLQMLATVLPDNADDKTITWSVENGTGKAIISETGLLTARLNGTVIVKAVANDGSLISGETTINISNQLARPTFKVVPLGDSKTAGGNGDWDQYSWRGLLRAKLIENNYNIDYIGSQQKRASGDVEPYDDDNCGYGGYTIGPDTYKFCPTCETTGLFEHITDWLNKAGYPDILILSAGINDLLGDGTGHPLNYKATTRKRYAALVDTIQKLRPNTRIILCTVEPVRWDKNWGGPGTDLGNLNDTIRSIANASGTDKIYLADLYSNFMAAWDLAFFYDDVHLSKLGATNTSNTIYDVITALMDNITPLPKVTSIVVSAPDNNATITIPKGTLQLTTAILPEIAADKSITWSVVNGTGSASISTDGLLTANTDGTVTVKATAKDGSNVSGQLKIVISNQSNGIPYEKNAHVTLFPNPVADILNIKSEGRSTVSILDITGKVVLSKTLEGPFGTLDLGLLNRGVYFVTVNTLTNQCIQKIIKK